MKDRRDLSRRRAKNEMPRSIQASLQHRQHLSFVFDNPWRVGLKRQTRKKSLQQVRVVLVMSKSLRGGRGPHVAVIILNSRKPLLKLCCVKFRAAYNGKHCGSKAVLFTLSEHIRSRPQPGRYGGEEASRLLLSQMGTTGKPRKQIGSVRGRVHPVKLRVVSAQIAFALERSDDVLDRL